MSDFPSQIVHQTAHRPWPMPDAPWIMTQSWHDLLFAHWPVDARQLHEKLPSGLELDVFNHQAWVGVIPFHMTNVTPRFVPAVPWLSAFPELNVRTYVRFGDKPGIYFFSLDADSAIAVAAARALFRLPYFKASMEVRHEDDWVAYRSTRTTSRNRADFVARYRPVGPVFEAPLGSLDYFLTERYYLYVVDETFHAHRLEIHHPPWRLQPAEAAIAVSTMADADGIRLPAMAPLLHFARRQDMVAWPLMSASRGDGRSDGVV